MTDPCRLTATDAARRIAAGSLRPRDLIESCLDRAATRERVVHAFAHLDATTVRAQADATSNGPLHGLPIGVKDVLDTVDGPTGYGSPIWSDHRPRADAAAVAVARAAGAVVLGKTVTTEFATRKPGPTANPLDPRRTPGGSSSGSAAAVADFMVPLAFGTQTAGSVIRPAAFCGVVGYKPSFGMIPRHGMKLMSESLDTVGVIARSVADCAFFASAVARRDLGDPDRKPDRPPRIGICRSPAWSAAAPETVALFERVEAALPRAGAFVTRRELPEAFREMDGAHPLVMNAESAQALSWELSTRSEMVSEGLRERLDWGRSHPPTAVDAARSTIERLRRAFPGALDGVDVLVTPAATGEAPMGLGWTGDPAFNFLWTALHAPCVTVPAGAGPNGMPLGVQIVGRVGEDRAVLAWAQWIAASVTEA